VSVLAAAAPGAHRAAVPPAAGELLERMAPGAFCDRAAWLAAPAEWIRRVRATADSAGGPPGAHAARRHNPARAAGPPRPAEGIRRGRATADSAGVPEAADAALANNAALAERCRLELELGT